MFTIDDIVLPKNNLRLLVESLSDKQFYKDNEHSIYEELGYLEIHKMDDRLYELYSSNVSSPTNSGNSYVSFLIGITTSPPASSLKIKGGSLPD